MGRLLKEFCWFGQANKTDDDPHQLGWRLNHPGEWPLISAHGLRGISAEAVAAFGVMHSTFTSTQPPVETSSPVSGCERMLCGQRSGGGPWESLPSGGSGLLLREVDVTDAEEVIKITDALVNDILAVPGGSVRDHLPPLREVLRRLLTEGLLNVHEHAYRHGMRARAWVSVVCLPELALRALYHAEAMLAPNERDFLKSLVGKQVLELVVADAGLGIPHTLAPSVGSLLPELAKKVRKVSSGQKPHELARAEIHAGLCYYGFHHDSTSKNGTSKKFKTPEHALNWRGLYRCYRQVAELGGGISVTSGRGRAGYVASANGVEPFHISLPCRTDLPGTLFTVRLPLPVRPRPIPAEISLVGGEPMQFRGEVVRWDNLLAKKSSVSEPITVVHSSLNFVAVALPFTEVVRDDEPAQEHRVAMREVRLALRQIELHSVPVFCFGTLPEDWPDFLRVFVADQNWHSAFDGPPRLIGFLTPQEKIHWVFAGAIPQEAQSALKQFENEGRWIKLKDTQAIVEKLFTELLAHHKGAISWHKKTQEFRLTYYGATIRGCDYKRVVEAAFAQYWQRQDVRNEVLTEEAGKIILLPSGTCVRRHFSVFKLLNQSPALSIVLSRAFARHLDEVFGSKRATIILDQPASRFIAHALLDGTDRAYESYTLDEFTRRPRAAGDVVLFADAILKGDTVRRAIEEIRMLNYQVARVIVAADLRLERGKGSLRGVPFASLVSPEGFAAEVVEKPGAAAIIQTDSITNVPLHETASTFVQLANTTERREILAKSPGLFCVGFHLRGGRTHTFTLPVKLLLAQEGGPERMVNWLADSVANSLERLSKLLKGREVVLFSWFDSRVGTVIERLAARFREPGLDASAVFSVRMPVAYRGSDTIYPRAGSDPLAGCTEIATGRFSFAGRKRPNEEYVAVYLADSAVTGNSLREFLHRLATAAKPKAAMMLAVVVINRLSPAEVRFFDLCPELQGSAAHRLPFVYNYLFTLQIRSNPGEGPIWNPLFEEVITDHALRVAELREYIAQLHQRAARLSITKPLLHLFCPDAEPVPVTTDVVRFRHLLALNQQNEPVVVEIIALLHQLTTEATEDASLLAILALEPVLLLDPPLRRFGREAILQLARRVLNRNSVPLALRSDALTVIAGFSGGLKQMLRSIAPAVFAERVLRRQLAVLLLVQQRQLPDSAAALVEACLKDLLPESQSHAQHLVHIVTVCTDRQHAQRDPNCEGYFRNVIQKLGNHLLHHAETLETEWDGVVFQLFSLTEEWEQHASKDRKAEAMETLRRACLFAEIIVLPTFSALAYFARGQGQVKLGNGLEDGQVKARKLLSVVRDQKPADPRALTKATALALGSSFEQLRKATWLAPSTERLPRGDFEATAVGVLPLALHQIFSSPPNLLVNLAKDVLGDSSAFSAIAEFSGGQTPPHLTVCPVPSHTLRHIFKLLLKNIEDHGDRSGLRVEIMDDYPRVDQDGTHVWAVAIINALGEKHEGEGQGLDVARRSAEQYGIKIESEELKPGETWRTCVVIPRCFYFNRINEPEAL